MLRHGFRGLSGANVGPERVVVAVGSNVGNRAVTINRALEAMKKWSHLRRTSFLYESAPMYVTDQPAFLNGVCEIETNVSPMTLLTKLKTIEAEVGRDFNEIRNGPRVLDLDIILYGDQVMKEPNENLVVPHPRLAEREFVLRPLHDIGGDIEIPTSEGSRTVSELLRGLLRRGTGSELVQVTPTKTGQLLKWGARTLLMGIINATPDSFSDGGRCTTVDSVLKRAEQFSKAGFDTVDIGGQSTRPGAESVDADEELRRVVPAVDAIRSEFPDLLISSDTYRAAVARETISHGAEIINDVSAGMMDENMHSLIRETGAATVQMHTRGSPATMQSLSKYAGTNIAREVGEELCTQLERAQDAGIPRWSIISDCGIGFAKQAEASAYLMRHGAEFAEASGGYPCLLGASRKSWLKGAVWGDGMEARDWATAGALGAAVAFGGVDMVRVHNAALADAVRAGDLVRRG